MTASPLLRFCTAPCLRMASPVRTVSRWQFPLVMGLVLAALGIGALPVPSAAAQSAPDGARASDATIAVALDDSSRATRRQATAILDEVRRITRSTHTLRRPDRLTRVVPPGAEGRSTLDALLRSDAQLVLGVGPRTALRLARRDSLSVPTVAAPLLAPSLQDVPRTPEARTAAHLAYVGMPGLVRQNMALLRSLTPTTRPALLVPQSLLQAGTVRARRLRRRLNARADSGSTWSVVPVPAQAPAAQADAAETASPLDALPPETDAAYVLGSRMLSPTQQDRLFAGLNARQVPSVVHRGRDGVERGALATSYAPDPSPLPRRAALHAAELLRGTPAGSLAVGVTPSGPPVLNAATAERLGRSLSTDTRLSATVVGSGAAAPGDSLRYAGAVRRGVRENPTLRATRAGVEAQGAAVQVERADFLPQVRAQAGARTVAEEQAAASFGAQPQRSASGGLSVSQTLYSPSDHAELTAAKRRRAARTDALNRARKDVALRAGEAYVAALRARSVAATQRQNLSLARENLALARSRREAGQIGRRAVLRFRTQVTQARQAVLEARAQVRVAKTRLKRVLDRPLGDALRLASLSPRDSILALTERLFARHAHGAGARRRLGRVLAEEGLSNAPALQALDAQIAAAQQGLRGARQSYWAPELSLRGTLNSRVLEGGAGTQSLSLPNVGGGLPQPPETTWNVGVSLSLPLFTGLRRDGTVERARAEVQRLRARRHSARTRLAEQIRSRTEQATASYLGLREAEAATGTAEETLALVQQSYTAGVADVLDLIDAQETVLRARLAETNAQYDFLLRLLQTERAVTRPGPLQTADERARLRERIRRAMAAE